VFSQLSFFFVSIARMVTGKVDIRCMYIERWILIQIHTTLTVVHPGWKKIVLVLLFSNKLSILPRLG